MRKQWYLINPETGSKKAIEFNDVISSISTFIKVNFLYWNLYSVKLTEKDTYTVYDRFSRCPAWILKKQ